MQRLNILGKRQNSVHYIRPELKKNNLYYHKLQIKKIWHLDLISEVKSNYKHYKANGGEETFLDHNFFADKAAAFKK